MSAFSACGDDSAAPGELVTLIVQEAAGEVAGLDLAELGLVLGAHAENFVAPGVEAAPGREAVQARDDSFDLLEAHALALLF